MTHRHLQGDHKLLRIFIGESDKIDHTPLYMVILDKARRAGLAGCTILRGIAGFGANSVIHMDHLFRLSHDLPIVIEIVDTAEHIKSFLHEVDPLLICGLVTEEDITVRHYRHAQKQKS